MRIYTGFGDAGNTRLLGGQTSRKSDVRVELCGELDELNASLGLAIACTPEPSLLQPLAVIQSVLFDIGAWVAAAGSTTRIASPEITVGDIQALESSIDKMQNGLPELKQFILPGGNLPGATLHLARTVCRRSERCLVRMVDDYDDLPQVDRVMIYLNRLSDWLFVAARWTNVTAGVGETPWVARREKNQAPIN